MSVAAPFAGVRVFLHIREPSDAVGGDCTKHHVKKFLRALGGSLTLSEETADMIVFHCGSESFLENATARGKLVVTPAYLRECASRRERLPVEDFVTRPGGVRAARRVQRNKTAAKEENNDKNRGTKGGKKEEEEREREREKPPTAVTLSTVPYLEDCCKEMNFTGAAVGALSSVFGDVGDDDATNMLHNDSLGNASGIQLLSPNDDGDEMEVKENNGDGRSSSNDKYSSSRNASATPMEKLKGCKGDSKNQTSGGLELNYNGVMKQHPSRRDDGSVSGSVCVAAPACGKAGASFAKRSKRDAGSSENVTMAAQRKRLRDNTSDVDTKKHLDGIRDKTRITRGKKRTLVTETVDATESTRVAADFCPITAPLASSSPRVAISGEDENTIQFLCDVVEQLGGVCVPRVYGRVQKPTHLVVEGRGELTPMVLLAKALGVPVLTPLWLHDAILLGAFPKVAPAHLHPMYSGNTIATIAQEKKEETSHGSSPHSLKRDTRTEDCFASIFKQDVGPHYRPIFLGMAFAFLDHSPPAHASQFIELVRTLGGSVSRSALSLNLSVIVDLGYGVVTSEEEAVKGGGPKARGRKSRRRDATPREDEAVLETQSLSMTYQTALTRGSTTSRHASHDVLCRVMAERARNNLPVIPAVSVEWIIQCILHGEVTETTPFEVPLTLDESVGEKKWDRARGGEDDRDSERKSALTPPVKMLRHESNKEPGVGPGHVVDLRRLLFVPSPLAKTSEGPKSAIKLADQQLNTQELLFSADSEDD